MLSHKLFILFLIILSTVGQYYALTPQIVMLENEPIEETTNSIEELKNLGKNKRMADNFFTENEKELDERLDDGKTNDKLKDNENSTTADDDLSIDKKSNEFGVLDKSKETVFNLNEKNGNNDLLFEDKLDNAEKELKKKDELILKSKSNDSFEGDSDDNLKDNLIDNHLTNSTNNDNSNDKPQDLSNEKTNTSLVNKFVDSLKPLNTNVARDNKEINGHRHHNETTSSSSIHKPIFSLFISSLIIINIIFKFRN